MRFPIKLAFVVLVGCFILFRPETTHRAVAAAQGRKTVVITRIFTGPGRLVARRRHRIEFERAWSVRHVQGHWSGIQRAAADAGANPGKTGATDPSAPDWHTGPARQFVITLSGSSEVEVSGGVHVLAGPGHINLIEDTTGKGHVTRNFGPEDRIALTIPLADGVVIEGMRKPRTR